MDKKKIVATPEQRKFFASAMLFSRPTHLEKKAAYDAAYKDELEKIAGLFKKTDHGGGHDNLDYVEEAMRLGAKYNVSDPDGINYKIKYKDLEKVYKSKVKDKAWRV